MYNTTKILDGLNQLWSSVDNLGIKIACQKCSTDGAVRIYCIDTNLLSKIV